MTIDISKSLCKHKKTSEKPNPIQHKCLCQTKDIDDISSVTVIRALQVETSGDAYMIVAGVPETSETHAQNVADFSLDMVAAARTIMSPATGKPIQVTDYTIVHLQRTCVIVLN